MKQSDLKVGTKVVCVFDGRWKGMIGTISEILSSGEYYVKDVHGDLIGSSSWSKLSSFELLEDAPTSLSDVVSIKTASTAPVIEEKKPCPRSYYGLEECTCKTCPPLRRRAW